MIFPTNRQADLKRHKPSAWGHAHMLSKFLVHAVQVNVPAVTAVVFSCTRDWIQKAKIT